MCLNKTNEAEPFVQDGLKPVVHWLETPVLEEL